MLKKFPLGMILEAFQGSTHYFEFEKAFKTLGKQKWEDPSGNRYLIHYHVNPFDLSIEWVFGVEFPEQTIKIFFESGTFEEAEDDALSYIKKKVNLTNASIERINTILARGKKLIIPSFEPKEAVIRAMRSLSEREGVLLEKETKVCMCDVIETLGGMEVDIDKGVKLRFDITDVPMLEWGILRVVISFEGVRFSFCVFEQDFNPEESLTALDANRFISRIMAVSKNAIRGWNRVGSRSG